jgi:hypothetical protein
MATTSSLLTGLSDVLTGDTSLDVTATINPDGSGGLNFSGQIGVNTYTSAALTVVGNAAPFGIISAPIQAAACANDIGLFTELIPFKPIPFDFYVPVAE